MSSLTAIIPSYLYSEYQDDDDLQAFVIAYNNLAQTYLDWFNTISLPNYTGAQINGPLLDWVAAGIYGIIRPTLPSDQSIDKGPLNTFALNTFQVNFFDRIVPNTFYATTDDIFKRILTWNLYKGDGYTFSIDWLKRRINRFLFGTNGIDNGLDNTYRVSVTFTNTQVNINLINGSSTTTSSTLINKFALNTVPLNHNTATFTYYQPLEFALIFKAALEAGALNLPFQFTYLVSIIV